jgi:hypothetical protein
MVIAAHDPGRSGLFLSSPQSAGIPLIDEATFAAAWEESSPRT